MPLLGFSPGGGGDTDPLTRVENAVAVNEDGFDVGGGRLVYRQRGRYRLLTMRLLG